MLTITSLTKRYGDVVALDRCTLTVARGRMLGFLGRNGAGKTTMMRAIFGLVTPDAGSVAWNGRPVTSADQRRFGYMPEERGLYPKMKVAEQLRYFGRLHGMSPTAAAQATTAWLDDLELADRADDPLEELSQGNQQRIQLAAALIHDPELLVLDEPFNGLDPIGASTMARVLRDRAAAGAAVMFSSHQLDVVEDLCEDVAIIHEGHIRVTGQLDRLKEEAPYRVVELDLTGVQAQHLGDVDGIIDATFDGRRHHLRVRRELDVRQLLRTIDADGRVQHLSYTTPPLAELFTEAVA